MLTSRSSVRAVVLLLLCEMMCSAVAFRLALHNVHLRGPQAGRKCGSFAEKQAITFRPSLRRQPLCLHAGLFGLGGMGKEEAEKLAVEGGMVPTLQDIDAVSEDGMTALSKAAAAGEIDNLKILLTAGADVSIKGNRGMSALYHAISGGHDEAVQELLKRGADANDCREDANSVLMHACGLGQAETAKALLDKGADANYAKPDGYTALMAVITADLEQDLSQKIVKVLLDAGASPNSQTTPEGKTALIFATQKGMAGVAALLLDAGADEYAMGKQAAGELVVEMGLLSDAAAIDAATASGKTPLGEAAEKGDLDGTKLLLCAGANVNAVDQEGASALYHCITGGHEHVSAELLLQGADPSAVRQDGNSVLMHASGLGRVAIVEQLLAAGADVNYAKEDGFSALTSAVRAQLDVQLRGQQVEVVRRLLQSGADPNLKTKGGESALAMATADAELDLVDLLLEAGASKE